MFSNPELPFWGTLRGVEPRTECTKLRTRTFDVRLMGTRCGLWQWKCVIPASDAEAVVTLKADRQVVT
jgi:hypothetical protein